MENPIGWYFSENRKMELPLKFLMEKLLTIKGF
jgi:hypothetical protein